jgi:hypothetical protein
MATRSNIGVQLANGDLVSVYCHWDGASHLPTLKKYYNTQELAEQLVSFGDISSLSETGTTVYYGRDRGEQDTNPTVLKFNPLADNTVGYYASKIFHNEYVYLFYNGKWTKHS